MFQTSASAFAADVPEFCVIFCLCINHVTMFPQAAGLNGKLTHRILICHLPYVLGSGRARHLTKLIRFLLTFGIFVLQETIFLLSYKYFFQIPETSCFYQARSNMSIFMIILVLNETLNFLRFRD
jgi:hypothetical protein